MSERLDPPYAREVMDQLRYDLLESKDVQDSPTASYSWSADQFGHFGLGFGLTLFLGWIVALFGWGGRRPQTIVAVVILLVFLGKELNDLRLQLKKRPDLKPAFSYDDNDLKWNVVTALFYIGIGCIVAGASSFGPLPPIVALLLAILPAALVAYWWLRRKICFQQAGLPFLFRLACFPNAIDPEIAKWIENELVRPPAPPSAGTAPLTPMHLLITGPFGSGRTSLAVGIGTEFSFKIGVGCYTTLAKLFESAGQPTKKVKIDGTSLEALDGRKIWPWERVDMVIIDDVDVFGDLALRAPAALGVALSPHAFVQKIVYQRIGPEKCALLGQRRTVWVLGDVANVALWQGTIASIMQVDSSLLRSMRIDIPVNPQTSSSDKVPEAPVSSTTAVGRAINDRVS